jgi:hypothetical protein
MIAVLAESLIGMAFGLDALRPHKLLAYELPDNLRAPDWGYSLAKGGPRFAARSGR